MVRTQKSTGWSGRRRLHVSDGRVPRGQEAISLVRTGQGVTERSRNMMVHENLKRVWVGTSGGSCRVRRARHCQGVRQKDRKTLSWVESGQVDTAK